MLRSFFNDFQETVQVQRYSESAGLLQKIDPRVKLLSLGVLVVSAVSVHHAASLLVLALVIIALFLLSRIPVRFFVLRTTVFVPIFAGLIVLPLPFVTPGTPIGTIGYDGLVLTVSQEGVYKAALFTFRIWICVAASVLLTSTTRFVDLIHAMDRLRLPKILVALTSISYRFIFLFVDEAYRMVLAMESRTIGRQRWRSKVRSLGSVMATLFIRSHERGERVYLAMKARGYDGTINTLRKITLKPLDLLLGIGFSSICLTVALIDCLRMWGF